MDVEIGIRNDWKYFNIDKLPNSFEEPNQV